MIPEKPKSAMTEPGTDRDGARARFPGGLIQPPGSFRFSLDALLLASFALRCCIPGTQGARVADLGCGSGPVGLACLLAREDISLFGIDVFPELTRAAEANAARLGLDGRFTAGTGDLASEEGRAALPRGAFDAALANMPYRRAGSGRPSRSVMRQKALFAGPETLPAFIKSAAWCLRPQGRFGLVYHWDTRRDAFAALDAEGFGVRRVLPVVTGGSAPRLCLAEALPDCAGRAEEVMPPLVLHGKDGAYTREALSFCPWLGRGASREPEVLP